MYTYYQPRKFISITSLESPPAFNTVSASIPNTETVIISVAYRLKINHYYTGYYNYINAGRGEQFSSIHAAVYTYVIS